MKNKLHLASLLSAAIVVSVLYGCSKSNQEAPVPQQQPLSSTGDGSHVYGLLPTPAEEYEKVPRYSEADFNSKFKIFAVTPKPAVLTLTTPAVRDQGQIGSCTGFCGSEAYEILYFYKHGAFPALVSPAFLYYQERVNIEGYSITADPGAQMVNINQVLTKYGISSEALMPYPNPAYPTTASYKVPPTSTATSYATGYKITSYTLINTGDTAAVKNCLRNHIPVMMGLNVYDSKSAGYPYFEGLNTTSYTYNPLTSSGRLASGVKLLGGHATPIIGYDDNKKAFLVQNSWSSSWGLNGFYYMPYSVFSSTTVVPQGGVYYATL